MASLLQTLSFAATILSSSNPEQAAIDWALTQAVGTEKGAILVPLVNGILSESEKLDATQLKELVAALVVVETTPATTAEPATA